MPDYKISLGKIPVEPTDIDEQLLAKAKAHLPEALRRHGEKAGEIAWKSTVDSFRGTAIKFNSSISAKSKFVQSMAKKFVANASAATRTKLVNSIFEQLLKQRDEKRGA